MPPLIVDPAVLKLRELSTSLDWQKLAARSAIETAFRVYAKCRPPQVTLAGLDASNYLQEIVLLVQADILVQHNAYGSIRWLWYLRRIPDSLFEGGYGTTLGYDRLLAEMLSSQFTACDTSELAERIAFKVDDAAFRHIVRYVGRVKLLSQLHMLYRRVGKGAVLDTSGPIFKAHTSDSIERAIKIYDVRHDSAQEFSGAGLGLIPVALDAEQIVDESIGGEPIAILSMACTPSFAAPTTFPDGAGGLAIATVQVSYLPQKLRVARILSPIGDEAGIPDYLPGISALIQLLMLVPAICAHVPWALSSIIQQGYVFVGEERLRDILNYHLPEIVEQLAPLTPEFAWPKDFNCWHESLLALAASLWPLSSGNVLRRYRNNLLIDTSSASQALLHRLELTRSPLLGNLRAMQFELQCQALIDGTSWEPPPQVRELRGRPLRQSGRALTDIDAIGVKERTLLVVSCKSIIYDRDYDRGVFPVIRNTQGTIDTAVIAWDAVVAELIRQPIGDNYDFSEFDEIIGVVCTPFVAYSNTERTLAFVKPKLRASSSIFELKDWLTSDSPREN
ncbi:MAG: hypothetical protein ACXW24_11510 [Telluria sp.]